MNKTRKIIINSTDYSNKNIKAILNNIISFQGKTWVTKRYSYNIHYEIYLLLDKIDKSHETNQVFSQYFTLHGMWPTLWYDTGEKIESKLSRCNISGCWLISKD